MSSLLTNSNLQSFLLHRKLNLQYSTWPQPFKHKLSASKSFQIVADPQIIFLFATRLRSSSQINNYYLHGSSTLSLPRRTKNFKKAKATILSSVYMGYEEEIIPYLGKIQHYPHFSPKKLGKDLFYCVPKNLGTMCNLTKRATTH